MSKLKFYIHSPGDESVGIWPINSEVEINDNVVWEESMINDTKRLLCEIYDTQFDFVLTEREFLLKGIEQEQQEIKMHQSELFDEPGDFRKQLEKNIDKCRNTIEAYERLLENPDLL